MRARLFYEPRPTAGGDSGSGWAPRSRQIETRAAPIRSVAELIGADTDSERAIRWLILVMVLCCDPLAIAITAAASARKA